LLFYQQFVYWRRKLEGKNDAPRIEPVPTSGFSRVTQVTPSPMPSDLTLSLPRGMTITGLHTGNVDLFGAILRQL